MSTPAPTRANAAYLEAMYQRYLADPSAVPDDWRLFFAGFEFAGTAPGTAAGGGVFGLVTAYREFGHLIAHLDPLSEPPATHPLLELANVGLAAADLDADVDPRPYRGPFRGTLQELVGRLRDTYCGTLGFEFMDIPDKSRRDWMEERIEARRDDPPLTAPERIAILERLIMADAFEQFLQVKYVGQKRFSLEGAAALVPMLDALIESAAGFGVEHIVIGYGASRPAQRAREHHGQAARAAARRVRGPRHARGDVGPGRRQVPPRLRVAARDALGPRDVARSAVQPEPPRVRRPGGARLVRARQALAGDAAREHSWPVLVHGEASFVGEGIVPGDAHPVAAGRVRRRRHRARHREQSGGLHDLARGVAADALSDRHLARDRGARAARQRRRSRGRRAARSGSRARTAPRSGATCSSTSCATASTVTTSSTIRRSRSRSCTARSRSGPRCRRRTPRS
jgi:2-oxoglutarate dehydrogenase E1 component